MRRRFGRAVGALSFGGGDVARMPERRFEIADACAKVEHFGAQFGGRARHVKFLAGYFTRNYGVQLFDRQSSVFWRRYAQALGDTLLSPADLRQSTLAAWKGNPVQPSLPDKPGRPLKVERRHERLDLPVCPKCRSAGTAVATRTDYVVYFRCTSCFEVWSVPIPGKTQLAG